MSAISTRDFFLFAVVITIRNAGKPIRDSSYNIYRLLSICTQLHYVISPLVAENRHDVITFNSMCRKKTVFLLIT